MTCPLQDFHIVGFKMKRFKNASGDESTTFPRGHCFITSSNHWPSVSGQEIVQVTLDIYKLKSIHFDV